MKINALSIIILDLFLCLLVIFMVQAAPPPEPSAGHTDPAFIRVELWWGHKGYCSEPGHVDADADLWGLAPGEPKAVGYSNKQGQIISLNRDDLGCSSTKDSQGYERLEAYGYYAGEWVANAHLYRYRSGPLPFPVHLIVSRRRPGSDAWEVVLDVKAQLIAAGQELTLARWAMDEKGDVVPGSINNLPMGLRS